MEEAEHAWLWTSVIATLGQIPLKVTNAYQTEYGKEFGMPKNILEILCLTRVFEQRTLAHFAQHRDLPGTHPKITAALQKMIDEGVDIRRFSDEILNAMKKISKEVVQELAESDPMCQKIFNHYSDFEQKAKRWDSYSSKFV